MLFKAIFVISLACFVSNMSAASRCWFDNCIAEFSDNCTSAVTECTEALAVDSINYFNMKHNLTLSTTDFSKKYDCFVSGVVGFAVIGGVTSNSYSVFKSCIPRNIKVCDLKKKPDSDKMALEAQPRAGIISGSTNFCGQCTGNLCNSAGALLGSWKILGGVFIVVFSKILSSSF